MPNEVIKTFVEIETQMVEAKYLELNWIDHWKRLGCSDVEADRAARVCMGRPPSAADQIREASRVFQYAAASMAQAAAVSRAEMQRMFASGGVVNVEPGGRISHEPLCKGEFIVPAGASLVGLGVGAGIAALAAAVEDAKWCDDQRFRLAGLTGLPMTDISLDRDPTSPARRYIARRKSDQTVLAYIRP